MASDGVGRIHTVAVVQAAPVAFGDDAASGAEEPLSLLRPSEGRLVLAGKLGPDNVRAAIDAVHPWAVDAASQLESEPGIKDHEKVAAFVRAVTPAGDSCELIVERAVFAEDFDRQGEGEVDGP